MHDVKTIMANLDAARDELRKLEDISDLEEQGYQSAPQLIAITGLTPEELMRHMITMMGDQDPDRNIGVIRWCLDQRRDG